MPDWGSALLGAAIGGLAAMGGAFLQAREARRARDADRREGAARLIGRIQSLLRECDLQGRGVAAPDDLRWRWGELRLELDILAASYPSSIVPELSEQLIRDASAVLAGIEESDQTDAALSRASGTARDLLREIKGT